MASFPTAKVHRVARDKLGRGQYVQRTNATVTLSSGSGTASVTLTFDQAVIINGGIPLTFSEGSKVLVSQSVTAPNVVVQVYSPAIDSTDITYAGNEPSVRTKQGAGCDSTTTNVS